MLAGSFWFLQVVQHVQYQEMAENNHQRTLTLRAPRGIIYDRTGKLLVENRNSFNISIDRERTKEVEAFAIQNAYLAGLGRPERAAFYDDFDCDSVEAAR